jgi:hypothetical protein
VVEPSLRPVRRPDYEGVGYRGGAPQAVRPGDLLLAQDRQLQIEQLAALGKAIVSSLRGEDQYDQIEGR